MLLFAVVFLGLISCSLNLKPWIGILKVLLENGKEAATGLILIKDNYAIALANDVAKLSKDVIRSESKAVFYQDKMYYECIVLDYTLHPEFYDNVVNTIALLDLNCGFNYVEAIDWLFDNEHYYKLRIVGVTDRNMKLKSISFRATEVNLTNCAQFYKEEEFLCYTWTFSLDTDDALFQLDYQLLWPSHVICARGLVTHKCVFDPGMSLVAKLGNRWKLVGISILGPGCALPSRFVHFTPYIPWINDQFLHKELDFRRQNSAMNKNQNETKESEKGEDLIDMYNNIVTEAFVKDDDFGTGRYNPKTLVWRPNLANVQELVYGNCTDQDGKYLYRDIGRIEAPGRTAIGTYALSLYDLHFLNITCITVNVGCKSRTVTNIWFDQGFRQEDLDQFVKIIPHPPFYKQTLPPKLLYIKEGYEQYEKILTTNIIFKFVFTDKATIKVEFYGNKTEPTPPPFPDDL